MHKTAVILFVCFLMIIGCSKKEHKTVGDSLTDNLSVSSVMESPEPAISEGNDAFLQGNFQDAISYYETGLRQNRAVAYYNIGVSYYMMQNVIEAEKNFRLALAEDPGFEEALMNLVAVLAEQEKSVEAEQYMMQLVNTKKSARVYVDMANLSIKNGSTAKAAYYFERAFAIDNESQFVLLNYANFLISIGQLDEGTRVLNLLEDKDFTVYYNLAYISWMQGNISAAYDYASRAAVLAQGSEEGYNKLAALFANMRRFTDEANTLRQLISWNPKPEYRLRLVRSYMRGASLEMAQDEVQQLLKAYPKDLDVIIAAYNVMIAMDNITAAGQFIREQYNNNPDDRLLYHLVRHMVLYDRNPDGARLLLPTAKQTPYANLGRAAYYIRTGDMANAAAALAKVPENTSNDYYVYRTFILLKDRKLNEAQTMALKIDESRPEYFWYNFVIAWNLGRPERILELTKNYQNDNIIATRVPNFIYYLIPIPEDMTLIFKFDGSGPDTAASLLYPFFIEPDEIYPFLALGYRMLRENDEISAIVELQRSIEYSRAVQLNNDGVSSLLQFDYRTALAKFTEAEKVLTSDPFLQYNMGLTLYLNGDFRGADARFEQAIKLNKYIVPAYVGRGLAMHKMGRAPEAAGFFEAALNNSSQYMHLEEQEIFLPMIVKARYLALIALNRMDKVIAEAAAEAVQDNFITAVVSVARFFQSGDTHELKTLADTKVYRAPELAHLLSMLYEPLSSLKERPFADRNTLMAAKFIMVMRTKSFTEEFLAPYMNESVVLTELVNLSMLTREKARGLKYLQTLSRNDFMYPLQYKASFYYFLWVKDFVNAEAAYMTLEHLVFYDQDTRYYRMLYFLLNYNKERFSKQIDDFVKAYPGEYRGVLMSAIRNLKNNKIPEFMMDITKLMQDEPYLFNKMPLELAFERF